MMVNAGLVPGALVLAVLAPAALGTAALGAGALGAAVLVAFDVTVGFSFGFRAAFAALLGIFIFSVHDFNGRRKRPPPRCPVSSPHSTPLPPVVCPALVEFMAYSFQTGQK
jgi:hypothetical protein